MECGYFGFVEHGDGRRPVSPVYCYQQVLVLAVASHCFQVASFCRGLWGKRVRQQSPVRTFLVSASGSQFVLQLQQFCQSHHVFGCTFAAASSVCRSDIVSLVLSVLGGKMVSGSHGLQLSQKLLVILVKLNNFPHIHSRAMWFNRCPLPRERTTGF